MAGQLYLVVDESSGAPYVGFALAARAVRASPRYLVVDGPSGTPYVGCTYDDAAPAPA